MQELIRFLKEIRLRQQFITWKMDEHGRDTPIFTQ
jgi:hypothetical protein